MTKVFIDGSAGTTGLRIRERLKNRTDLDVFTLGEELRKDDVARAAALNASDVAFLCLPDAAAVAAAKMVENPETIVIDTSTAHRCDDDWVYGFPEIGALRERIKAAKRIANPGCHASGFIALVAPLVENGLLPADSFLSCVSLTGYTGGGKKMIADYEDPARAEALRAPRLYGLGQTHKHLPEMVKLCGLKTAPAFHPVVAAYAEGMEVVVTVPGALLGGTPEQLKELYRSYYTGGVVRYADADEDGFLSAGSCAGYDHMLVGVFGNSERVTLISRFDNLGKGASGAAIQNMNLALGLDETTGLDLPEV